MPTVPVYDNAKVMPSPGQAPEVQDPYSSGALRLAKAVGAEQGQQASQTGAALTDLGDGLGAVANDQALELSATQLADAQNQARTLGNQLTTNDQHTGYQDQTGKAALPQSGGKSLPDAYGESLSTGLRDIRAKIINPNAQHAFDLWSNDYQTQFREQVANHAARQSYIYQGSTFQAMADTAADTILKNADDPDTVDTQIKEIRAATNSLGNLNGDSPFANGVKGDAKVSSALRTVVEQKMKNGDTAGAQAFFNRWNFGNNFSAGDAGDMKTFLDGEKETGDAQSAAAYMSTMMSNRWSPSSVDNAWQIVKGMESRGQQFTAGGAPLTSSKGAVGLAQIMPTTGPEAAQLAGVAWDPDRFKTDPAYNELLGRAYFSKQVQTFGGDFGKAFAAYNAGPGTVQKAVADAQAAGQPSNWLDYMAGHQSPANASETRNYVTRGTAILQAGGGTQPPPTEDEALRIGLDRFKQMNPTATPQAVQKATQIITQQFERDQKSAQETGSANYANALRLMIANKAGFYDLPSDVRNAVPAPQQKELVDFGNTLQKGPVADNLAVYLKMTQPGELASLSDHDFFNLHTQFTDDTWKKLAAERQEQLSGTSGKDAFGVVNRPSLNAGLDMRLQQIGINAHPKVNDTENQQRVGAINKYATDSLLRAQAAAGHKFNDAEIGQHLDNLFLKDAQFKSGLTGPVPPKRLLGMSYNDIPGSDRAKIVAAFAERGISNPSHGDILNAFFETRTNPNTPQNYSPQELRSDIAAKFGNGGGR